MSLGSLQSALAGYTLYDIYPQFCLLRGQDMGHDYPYLMIRNQACERLIEGLKVPVLVNGKVTDSKSRLVLVSFKENFQESKGLHS